MNDIITNNLFEFWDLIGQKNNIYKQTSDYKSVSAINSDWPRRVYAITDRIEIYEEVIELSSKNILPDIITVDGASGIPNSAKIQLRFAQTNMSLDLSGYKNNSTGSVSIHPVTSRSDAFEFAHVATESFGYRVEGAIVYSLCRDNLHSRLFLFKEKKESYGCGIVFFDKSNVAGFHMIGTIPKGRGKGIGKSITERLISEAVLNNCEYCVLHASVMGKQLYTKLGFEVKGLIKNYTVLR